LFTLYSIYFLRIFRLFKSIVKLNNLFLIGLILSAGINSFCQQKQILFKHITASDGLSNSHATCAFQDYLGFMWIGTYDGLNRYDGTNMVIYKNVPSDESSLPENHVRAIFEDHDKNLFIGTWEGLSLYNRDSDLFVNYRFEKSSALFGLKMRVFKIAEDSSGNLWLGTDNGLIFFR
jgi:ligand-binding sensor domain-containing protein